MSNAVTTPANAAVAALTSGLRAGIQRTRSTTLAAAGRTGFLRFLQDGNWVHGTNNVEVTKGVDVFLINVGSFRHGFQCWTDNEDKGKANEMLGEELVPISEERPAKADLPKHPFPWKDMIQFELKGMSGPTAGTQFVYGTTSVGGMNAADAVLEQVQLRLDEEAEEADPAIFPVVVMSSDHYNHKKWGRTYTPVIKIVGWATMSGEIVEGPDDVIDRVERGQKAVRDAAPETVIEDKSAAAKPAVVEEADEPPVSEAPASEEGAVQRRRRR